MKYLNVTRQNFSISKNILCLDNRNSLVNVSMTSLLADVTGDSAFSLNQGFLGLSSRDGYDTKMKDLQNPVWNFSASIFFL